MGTNAKNCIYRGVNCSDISSQGLERATVVRKWPFGVGGLGKDDRCITKIAMEPSPPWSVRHLRGPAFPDTSHSSAPARIEFPVSPARRPLPSEPAHHKGGLSRNCWGLGVAVPTNGGGLCPARPARHYDRCVPKLVLWSGNLARRAATLAVVVQAAAGEDWGRGFGFGRANAVATSYGSAEHTGKWSGR